MPQQVTLTDAQQYFDTYVLHSEAWDEADETRQTKALNQAEKDLYEYFTDFDMVENPLPDEAIYEQALWLLRIDEALQKAEMGVTNITVEGISISVSSPPPKISPKAIQKVEFATGYNPNELWTVI